MGRDLSNAILRLRRQTAGEKIEELQRLQYEAKDNGDIDSVRTYIEMAQLQTQLCDKLDKTRDALSLMGKRRAEANQYGHAV